MKKLYFLLFTVLISAVSFGQQPILTIISDGDCSGGNPKMVEIYADGMVDFSLYSIERQSNGGSWGTTTNLASFGVVTDDFIYVYTDSLSSEVFATEYPSATPNIENGVVNVNGDDGIRIVLDADGSVVDQFGATGVDGTGEAWEYTDGFAKRVDGTGPDGGFSVGNWTYNRSGLDGEGDCQGGTIFETVMGGVGVYSTTGSSTPMVNLSGSVNLFYFETNGPSSEGSITVSGNNLGDDVTVTAPTNFEISETSGGTFGASLSYSPTSGTTLDPTTLYIRLAAGLTENTYSGDVTATTAGATDATLTVNGEVGPDDPIIFTAGSIFGIEYTVGTMPSSADSFGVSALFLVDDLVIDAPTNFEVALVELGPYSAQVSITPDGNGEVMSTDIWVRLVSGLAVGNYTGDVNISSTGATSRTEAASGDVNPAATCPNPGDIFVTEIMQNPDFVGDNSGEYFEVYNNTASPIDMVGFVISDNGSNSHTIGSSLIVPANGYAVLGINSDPGTNGGITIDYEYSDFSLGNSDDEVIITCSGTVIDKVEYDGGPNFPDPTGASMELSSTLFDLRLDNLDNNVGTNWGPATTAISGTNTDLGTPGGANSFALSTDNFDRNSFFIYPNPTNTGEVTISTLNSTPINVVVYDILGKQVQSETISNNTLNVSNLRSGIYLLRLEQDGATTTKKLVIE